MDALWVGLIATSVIAFLLKYVGHSVPEKWLSHPRVLKINGLIPIALLSALVAVQTFTNVTTESITCFCLSYFKLLFVSPRVNLAGITILLPLVAIRK